MYYNKTMKKVLLIIIMIICAITFVVCAYFLVEYFWTSHKSEEAFDSLKGAPAGDDAPSMDADAYEQRRAQLLKLKAENADVIGWLNIEGTRVDYPVMQTKDDQDYYIRRDFEKQYSTAGTLFASEISNIGEDAAGEKDPPSDVITIYGHMMKAGTMFGGLKKYTEKDYWENHRQVRFDTLTEERNYEIMCVFKTAVNTGSDSEFKYYSYSDFKDEEDFNDFIAQAVSRQFYSTGVKISYGDELLLLSTCEYSQKNGRLIVIAVRTS